MDDVKERILDALEKINDRLNKTDISLAEIKGDLKVHMSRTYAVEKTNELLQIKVDAERIAVQLKIDQEKDSLDKRVSKLEKWSDKFHYLGWVFFGGMAFLEKIDVIKSFIHSFFSTQ